MSEGRRTPSHSASKPKLNQSKSVRAADSEMEIDDFYDEMRDQVYDYENSQALVLMADEYL